MGLFKGHEAMAFSTSNMRFWFHQGCEGIFWGMLFRPLFFLGAQVAMRAAQVSLNKSKSAIFVLGVEL